MPQKPNKLSRFWQELKRRRVIHVITVYASAAFVIIELVGNLEDPLNLPSNLSTIIIILLAVGFPLAIVLSWLYDLTAEGVSDWSHWGNTTTAPNQNNNLSNLIGTYEDVGTVTPVRYTDNPAGFSWTNGTPDGAAADSTTGIYFATPFLALDEGIRLRVPAGVAEQTLKVYLGAYSGRAQFKASLEDASATDIIEFLDSPLNSAIKTWVVTVNFSAAAGGDLIIEYTLDQDSNGDGANISLQAATLN